MLGSPTLVIGGLNSRKSLLSKCQLPLLAGFLPAVLAAGSTSTTAEPTDLTSAAVGTGTTASPESTLATHAAEPTESTASSTGASSTGGAGAK